MTRLQQWLADHPEVRQQDVADLTGYSPSMICRLASGERSLGALDKVRFARRLDVAVADLFDVDPCEIAG